MQSNEYGTASHFPAHWALYHVPSNGLCIGTIQFCSIFFKSGATGGHLIPNIKLIFQFQLKIYVKASTIYPSEQNILTFPAYI